MTGARRIDPGTLADLRWVYRSLDAAIADAATSSRDRFADVRSAFNPPGSLMSQKARLCAYSFICSKSVWVRKVGCGSAVAGGKRTLCDQQLHTTSEHTLPFG